MLPTNAMSWALSTSCLPWTAGVAGQGQPLGRGDPLALQLLGSIALGREDEIERVGLLQAPGEVQMRVDRPPGGGAQIGGEAVLQSVVDVQVEVEALPRNRLQLRRPEMLDLDQIAQRAPAIHAGRFRAACVVEDQRDPSDVHRDSFPGLGTDRPRYQRDRSTVSAVSFEGVAQGRDGERRPVELVRRHAVERVNEALVRESEAVGIGTARQSSP